MIDKATVDRIYSAADIVEVIGDFVTLKKKGVNYQACCPFHNEKSCRIYPLHAEGEEAVVKNLAGSREVTTLAELEDAVNAPEVANVFIGRFAAVTSKGMKNVLSRTSLAKDIFCAFEIRE